MVIPKIPKYLLRLSFVGTAVGSFVLWKESIGGDVYEGSERLDNKTVIITGATSGIGKATAENMAKRGGRIIMACRDMDKCATVCQELIKATSNQNLFCRHLDLASIKSIKEFAKEFNNNEERLDILVNNAGVLCKKRSITKDGFESQMGINFLGRFLLTRLLLDKMKSTDSWGRIINVVCIGYDKVNINFNDFNQEQDYRADVTSKIVSLANINFTKELAEKLKGSNVGVYAVNPGLVETNLRCEYGTHKSMFSSFILKPLWLVTFKLPRQASQTIVHCAISPTLEKNESGKLFYETKEVNVKEDITSDDVRKRLWATAEHWTNNDHLKSSSSSSPPQLTPTSSSPMNSIDKSQTTSSTITLTN